jgi:hypothetical protein
MYNIEVLDIVSLVVVLGSKLVIINKIFVSVLFLIGLGAILRFTIASILDRGAESPNMRRIENRELSRRLEEQCIFNRATGQRRTYLGRDYPSTCSLRNHPHLLLRFNATI